MPRRKNLDAGELLNLQVAPENPPGQSLWLPLPWIIRKLLWLWSMTVWLIFSFVVLTIIIIDNALWITIIVAAAGQMLVEGLYESQQDFKILLAIDQVQSWIHRAELLTAIVSGNVRLNKDSAHDPQILIKENLGVQLWRLPSGQLQLEGPNYNTSVSGPYVAVFSGC